MTSKKKNKCLTFSAMFRDIESVSGENLSKHIDKLLSENDVQDEFKSIIERIIDTILITSGLTKSMSEVRLETSSEVNDIVSMLATLNEDEKTKLRNLLFAFGLKTMCYLEEVGLINTNKVFQVADSDKHFIVFEEIKNE